MPETDFLINLGWQLAASGVARDSEARIRTGQNLVLIAFAVDSLLVQREMER